MCRFHPENAPESFGGRALSGPAGRLLRSPRHLAGFKEWGWGQGKGKGERQEDTEEGGDRRRRRRTGGDEKEEARGEERDGSA